MPYFKAYFIFYLIPAKSGKTERQFRFIGLPFRFSGTLDYN